MSTKYEFTVDIGRMLQGSSYTNYSAKYNIISIQLGQHKRCTTGEAVLLLKMTAAVKRLLTFPSKLSGSTALQEMIPPLK